MQTANTPIPMTTLAEITGELTGVIIVALCISGVLIYSLIKTIGQVLNTRARELTKREMSAYVAEGSISPDSAERLLRAGSDSWPDQVAEMVKDGHLDSGEAERLLKAHAATSVNLETRPGMHASPRGDGQSKAGAA